MYKPTGDIIQLAVGDRKRAFDLCNQSIEDIESVKKELPVNEYDKLIYELNLQKRFVELSILHIEVYLRFIINRDNPSKENFLVLRKRLAEMEEMANLVDNEYGDANYLLSGNRIREFVKDIKQLHKVDLL